MIALPARGGKLRCESPQPLSDPSDPPFSTTLPFPFFDPSGLMAWARNPDRIARAPAPGINKSAAQLSAQPCSVVIPVDQKKLRTPSPQREHQLACNLGVSSKICMIWSYCV